jgi:hypothetical protein
MRDLIDCNAKDAFKKIQELTKQLIDNDDQKIQSIIDELDSCLDVITSRSSNPQSARFSDDKQKL